MTSGKMLAGFALAVTSAFCGARSHAEVVSADAAGFSIAVAADVPTPPPSAWAALTDVARWWNPEHTFSGDARNLELQPIVRGCFCEKLGLYGGIEHMRVVYAQPPKILRLSGALGPLQEFAVQGSMTFRIEPDAGGSHVTLTYNVAGRADRPLDQWAPIADSVLKDQMQRFAKFAAPGAEQPADAKADKSPQEDKRPQTRERRVK